MKAFAATWNASQDSIWEAEFFGCWEGPGFGNTQNEQGALYREQYVLIGALQHISTFSVSTLTIRCCDCSIRHATDFREDLQPKSWLKTEQPFCSGECKIPRVFKPMDWTRPWAHGSPLAAGNIEWRVFPTATFDQAYQFKHAMEVHKNNGAISDKAASYNFGQVVLMHYVNVESKVVCMDKAGLWRPSHFSDRNEWCSYDAA
jgi:hypothetical protein